MSAQSLETEKMLIAINDCMETGDTNHVTRAVELLCLKLSAAQIKEVYQHMVDHDPNDIKDIPRRGLI